MDSQFDENLTLSPAFIQQVRDLLEHLYDFPYLQKQNLVLTATENNCPVVEIPGQKARKLLLEALEKIGEEKSLSFRSSQARFYNLLKLHYIEGMSVNDVARELGLSQRQTYRDLRLSDERIAAIVWSVLVKQYCKPEANFTPAPQVEDEKQSLELQFHPTALNELITNVCEIVHPLAQSRSVHLSLNLPEHPVIIPTDAMIARQVITGLLSQAIQQATDLQVGLSAQGKDYVLKFCFLATRLPEKITDPSIVLYAQNLGWVLSQTKDGERVEMCITIRSHSFTCLIIDDNPGFVELLERYVAHANVHVLTANNGPEGIRLAQQLQPDVVILDVMIPEMDGWQVLQRLHSSPAGKTIPVIVCSVFYDPDLAFTLGAVDVLKKPVRQEDFILALQKLKIL